MEPDPKRIDIEVFEKLEIRVGAIKAVKQHPELEDYIILVDLGTVEQDIQVIANIKDAYTMEDLVGKQVCVVLNIKEQEIKGFESQGLLLTTTREGKTVLLTPESEVHPGVKVYGVYDGKRTHVEEIGR